MSRVRFPIYAFSLHFLVRKEKRKILWVKKEKRTSHVNILAKNLPLPSTEVGDPNLGWSWGLDYFPLGFSAECWRVL